MDTVLYQLFVINKTFQKFYDYGFKLRQLALIKPNIKHDET